MLENEKGMSLVSSACQVYHLSLHLYSQLFSSLLRYDISIKDLFTYFIGLFYLDPGSKIFSSSFLIIIAIGASPRIEVP